MSDAPKQPTPPPSSGKSAGRPARPPLSIKDRVGDQGMGRAVPTPAIPTPAIQSAISARTPRPVDRAGERVADRTSSQPAAAVVQTPPFTSGRPRQSLLSALGVKVIDQYVLGQFLRNYALALFVLLGLYIVMDMVFNFDEFVEVTGGQGVGNVDGAWAVIQSIATFYFFQSFRVFNVLAGVVPVVAAAFTFMRMSRFNETAALMAAGVSLRRVAAPVIFAAAMLSVVLVPLNQELIVPRFMNELTRERGTSPQGGQTMRIQAMLDGAGGLVFGGLYTAPTPTSPATIDRLDVLVRTDTSQYLLSADKAVFDTKSGSWLLTNGSERSTTTGQSIDSGKPVAAYAGGINPESIALFRSTGNFSDLLSTARINQLLALPNAIGVPDLLRVRATRYAAYVLNIFLVILTIPFVLTREPMQLRTSTIKVFVMIGTCMAMVFVSHHLAGRPPVDAFWLPRWAVLVAFSPVILIAVVAVYLFDRIKT